MHWKEVEKKGIILNGIVAAVVILGIAMLIGIEVEAIVAVVGVLVIGAIIALVGAYIYDQYYTDTDEIVVDSNLFNSIFSTNRNMNLPVPTQVLQNNTVRFSNPTHVNSVVKKILRFYLDRGIIIEFQDSVSGFSRDTYYFKDIKQTNDKPVDGKMITKHEIDLCRYLGYAKGDVTFELAIPKRQVFSIEMPSRYNNTITLLSMLEDDKVKSVIDAMQITIDGMSYTNGMPILLGGAGNSFLFADAAKSPHILIGGATGSGKSVATNLVVLSSLMLHTPETLHLYLADLKGGLELADFADVPHTKAFADTIPEAEEMIETLVTEMERRNKILRKAKKKNITDYNSSVRKVANLLPLVLLVVDEFVILKNSEAALDGLIQLSALARSAGIYLVLVTQRPEVQVVDGLIKANLNLKVAFKTASEIDSRIIIDSNDAATLRGAGDGLLRDANRLTRFQGTYMTDRETKAILNFWKT